VVYPGRRLPGQRPKTFARWLIVSGLANGCNFGPDTPLADMVDAVGMLVATGRAVPAHRWVDSLIARAQVERVASMPHNLC
jgi:hypothetical protein